MIKVAIVKWSQMLNKSYHFVLSNAQVRHQTFQELNLIWIKADPSYIDYLIQMLILIPAELNSKGEKYSFWLNCLQNMLL